ncbi:MAG: EamA family transporter [Pedobacter sp.]|nr:EamA family transporter [Pedobacter sp.]
MLKGILLVFFGACSYGVLSTFVKFAYQDGYTLGDVTGTQAFFGAIGLWILFFIRKSLSKKTTDFIEKTPVYQLLLAGICSGCVSIFYYQSVKLVPNSIAIILLMQFIWIGILLEYFIFKKKITRVQIFSILLVLGGTALASGIFASTLKTVNVAGIVYGLLAAVCYAGFMILNGRLGNDYRPMKKAALMVTGSCIFIFIIFPPMFLINGALTESLLKWGLLIALFGTTIPPLCYAIGVPKTGLALSSILSAAELPVAVLLSALFLHEHVSVVRWFGVAIILSAIAISNIKQLLGRRRRTENV